MELSIQIVTNIRTLTEFFSALFIHEGLMSFSSEPFTLLPRFDFPPTSFLSFLSFLDFFSELFLVFFLFLDRLKLPSSDSDELSESVNTGI